MDLDCRNEQFLDVRFKDAAYLDLTVNLFRGGINGSYRSVPNEVRHTHVRTLYVDTCLPSRHMPILFPTYRLVIFTRTRDVCIVVYLTCV